MEIVKLVEVFKGINVVGFDFVVDEVGFLIDEYIKVFKYVKKYGILCIVYVGEVCGVDSVWEILCYFYFKWIGYGVCSIEDFKLMVFFKEEGIYLEVCLISNV